MRFFLIIFFLNALFVANALLNVTERVDFETLMKESEINPLIALIYSETDATSINFMPKFEKLEKVYFKNSGIKFIHLVKENESVYKGILSPATYPALFLIKKGIAIQYSGLYEVDDINDFINNKRSFEQCREISTVEHFDNLIEDKLQFANEEFKHSSFIFAVFKDSEKKEEIVKKFNAMNNYVGNIINEDQCFYLFYTGDIQKSKYVNFFSSVKNNFIFTFNYQKGFSTFPFANFEGNDNGKDFEVMVERYKQFLKNKLFPYYLNYSDEQLNDIISREKKFVIYGYTSKAEYDYFLSQAKEYILSNDYDGEFTILFVNLSEENYFTKQLIKEKKPSVYVSGKNFKDLTKMKTSQLDNTIDLMFTYTELLNLIKNASDKEVKAKGSQYKPPKSIKERSKENEKKEGKKEKEVQQSDKKEKNDKFLSQPEAIQNSDYDDPINTKIVLLPLYLIIYSVFFYFFYTKILVKYFYREEIEEEIKVL